MSTELFSTEADTQNLELELCWKQARWNRRRPKAKHGYAIQYTSFFTEEANAG